MVSEAPVGLSSLEERRRAANWMAYEANISTTQGGIQPALVLHHAPESGVNARDAGKRGQSDGLVRLGRSTIEGRLLCTRGSFKCFATNPRDKGGHAIEAVRRRSAEAWSTP